MGWKGTGVVTWKAEGRGSVADKVANLLHYSLRNIPLPHVVQQPCWYDSNEGPGHVN